MKNFLLNILGKSTQLQGLESRLASGALWSVAGSLVSRGAMLISAIIVGRILGVSNYGELAIFQNTVGTLATVSGVGLSLLVNKHIAQNKLDNPHKAGEIVALVNLTALSFNLILSILLFVLAPYIATRILQAGHLELILRVGSLLMFFSGFNSVQLGMLTGYESFKMIAKITLVSNLVAIPVTVAGAMIAGVFGAVLGLTLNQLFICLLCAFALRRDEQVYGIVASYKTCKSQIHLLWSFGTPTIVADVVKSLTVWISGALIVSQVEGYTDFGVYSAALKIKLLPEAVMAMVLAPILPIISEYFGKDNSKYQSNLSFCFSASLLIILPFSILLSAAPSLTLMPFGDQYDTNTKMIGLMWTHSFLYALTYPVTAILISQNKMWFYWRIQITYALLLLCLAFVAIPKYGATGFVFSMIASHIVANIPAIIFLYKSLPELMHRVSWHWNALLALCLVLVANGFSSKLKLPASIALGTILICIFVIGHYMLSRFSQNYPKNRPF